MAKKGSTSQHWRCKKISLPHRTIASAISCLCLVKCSHLKRSVLGFLCQILAISWVASQKPAERSCDLRWRAVIVDLLQVERLPFQEVALLKCSVLCSLGGPNFFKHPHPLTPENALLSWTSEWDFLEGPFSTMAGVSKTAHWLSWIVSPTLMGRFPPLMGRCPECLNGPFSLLKTPWKTAH